MAFLIFLTISVDVTPLPPVESFNMASACGGVVFASPTRCLFSIIDSLPCTNLLRLFFLLRRTSLLHVLGKLTLLVLYEAERLPHLRRPRIPCSVARGRAGSRTLDLRAQCDRMVKNFNIGIGRPVAVISLQCALLAYCSRIGVTSRCISLRCSPIACALHCVHSHCVASRLHHVKCRAASSGFGVNEVALQAASATAAAA